MQRNVRLTGFREQAFEVFQKLNSDLFPRLIQGINVYAVGFCDWREENSCQPLSQLPIMPIPFRPEVASCIVSSYSRDNFESCSGA